MSQFFNLSTRKILHLLFKKTDYLFLEIFEFRNKEDLSQIGSISLSEEFFDSIPRIDITSLTNNYLSTIKSGEIVSFDSGASDLKTLNSKKAGNIPYKSIICVPVSSEARVTGIIVLYSKKSKSLNEKEKIFLMLASLFISDQLKLHRDQAILRRIQLPENDHLTQKSLSSSQECEAPFNNLNKLGMVSGSIIHEIRNPLGSINNSIYFLNMILDDIPPKAKKHLMIIQRSIWRIDSLISNILTYTRISSPLFKTSDIYTILAKAIELAEIPDNIIVKIISDHFLPEINADAEQIALVFKNIISNAVDSMPDGGELDIAPEFKDNRISVMFKDTGSGIEESLLPYIFLPSVSGKKSGFGLGLYFAKCVVEAHKGKIKASSQPEIGAEITITFPSDGAGK